MIVWALDSWHLLFKKGKRKQNLFEMILLWMFSVADWFISCFLFFSCSTVCTHKLMFVCICLCVHDPPSPVWMLCNHSSVRSLWGMAAASFVTLPPFLLFYHTSPKNKDGCCICFHSFSFFFFSPWAFFLWTNYPVSPCCFSPLSGVSVQVACVDVRPVCYPPSVHLSEQ